VGGGGAGRRPPMTAPVGGGSGDGAWVVTFTMPLGETLESLPVPDDPRVTLHEAPAARVAVHRFSGRWTDGKYAEKTAALRAWLGASDALMVSCYLSVEHGLARRDVIERRVRAIRATLPTSQRGELDGTMSRIYAQLEQRSARTRGVAVLRRRRGQRE